MEFLDVRARVKRRCLRYGALISATHLRRIGLVCLAVLSLGQVAAAQTLKFDVPLSVMKVKLPLNHPPVDFACTLNNDEVLEVRYWQKNPADEGEVVVEKRPGPEVPPCDKTPPPEPEYAPLLVTCSVYASFIVKERQSEGQEGDDGGISVVPLRQGKVPAPCDDKMEPGEFFLQPILGSEWLMGVVGRYVFLAAGDDDSYGWDPTNVFRADTPQPIMLTALLWGDDRTQRITRVAGGFDLRFMADFSLDCGPDGAHGAACLARLERAAGANISLAQCLKAVPKSYLNKLIPGGFPVALEYPALLSVRGSQALLRATGPGVGCVASD